jgi:hypothetical protein
MMTVATANTPFEIAGCLSLFFIKIPHL